MKVRYRARALEDVDGIYQWRARQSTNVAEKVEAAVLAAAEWLGEHPEFGTMTDQRDVRRWPMTDFRYQGRRDVGGKVARDQVLQCLRLAMARTGDDMSVLEADVLWNGERDRGHKEIE